MTQTDRAQNGVFRDLCFFLVQQLPQRSTYVERILAGGGRVVKLESQAQYVVADHLRKNAPAGSLSYTFIERAIRDGALPDPANHRAGPIPGVVRAVGSSAPRKTTRTKFTAEDDRALMNHIGTRTQYLRGDEIYKELEKINDRHPWQAWRSRYVKILEQLRASKPTEEPTAVGQSDEQRLDFTEAEYEELLYNAGDLENIPPENLDIAWRTFASAFPHHTAEDWREFYETTVRPEFLSRQTLQGPEEQRESTQQRMDQRTAAVGEVSLRSPLPPSDEPERSQIAERAFPQHPQRPLTPPETTGRKRWLEVSRSSPPTNKKRKPGPSLVDDLQRASQQLIAPPTASLEPRITNPLSSSEPVHTREQIADLAHDMLVGSKGTAVSAPTMQTLGSLESQSRSRGAMFDIPPSSLHSDHTSEVNEATVSVRRGHDLTEANLASQQAQHRAQLLRGHDLPEDSDTQSQSDFIQQLQNIVPKPDDPRFSLLDRAAQDTMLGKGRRHKKLADDEHPSLHGGVRRNTPRQTQRESQQHGAVGFQTQIDHPFSDPALLPEISPHKAEANEVEAESNSVSEDEMDLTIPEPEGGFGFSSSPVREGRISKSSVDRELKVVAPSAHYTRQQPQDSNASSTSPSSTSSDRLFVREGLRGGQHNTTMRRALETQDILDAETQQPDFHVPPPPDSDLDSDEVLQLTRQTPSFQSAAGVLSLSQASVPQTQSAPEDTDTFISTMIVRGFQEDAVIRALKCTSMRSELAELVLLEDSLGRGLPNDISGVWSEQEDLALEGRDGKALRKLEEKHSWEECEARMNFLLEWRQ